MLRLVRISTAMLVASCGACSLILPLSDYDTGTEDGGSPAPAPDATAGRVGDAGDAARPDAASTDGDSAQDAALVDASRLCDDGGEFCQQNRPYLFCNDFDVGLNVTSGWSSVVTSDAATLSRVSDVARSCPSSLQGLLYPFDSGTGGGTVAIAQIPGAPGDAGTVQCDFDWFVQQLSTSSADSVLFTQFQFGQTTFGYVIAPSGNITLADTPSVHSLGSLPSLGAWHHLSIAFAVTGAAGSYTFSLDDAVTTDTLVQQVPSDSGFTLVVGPLDESDESTGWSFNFDNVICR